MKKVDINAFTLPELIATLAIIGILALIAIPGVGKMQEKFRQSYYDKLNDTIIASTKTYFKENTGKVPLDDEIIQLDYYDLISGNYLEGTYDTIKGYKDDTCTGEVEVRRNGSGYTYTNKITCTDSKGNTVYQK